MGRSAPPNVRGWLTAKRSMFTQVQSTTLAKPGCGTESEAQTLQRRFKPKLNTRSRSLRKVRPIGPPISGIRAGFCFTDSPFPSSIANARQQFKFSPCNITVADRGTGANASKFTGWSARMWGSNQGHEPERICGQIRPVMPSC